MKSSDCVYYNNGNCAKALPNVECKRKGCVAYQPQITLADRRKVYNFDCHYYNGNIGCCDLMGGECERKCKNFISDDKYFENRIIDDMKISVPHLRSILAQCVSVGYINEYSMHRIMDLVKKEI